MTTHTVYVSLLSVVALVVALFAVLRTIERLNPAHDLSIVVSLFPFRISLQRRRSSKVELDPFIVHIEGAKAPKRRRPLAPPLPQLEPETVQLESFEVDEVTYEHDDGSTDHHNDDESQEGRRGA